MKNTKEKVLVFSSREICYLSGNFFANQIGAAFEELGADVEICELAKEDNLDEKLEPLTKENYKVILDFNSLLPRMVMEDDEPYLNRLNGPFFDYVLDHPLFHYNSLHANVKNMHVIVLDEAQCDYVQQYYTKVKSVHMLPLGATRSAFAEMKYMLETKKDKDMEKNTGRIFFSGTYDCPNAVYALVEDAPEPLCGIMKDLIAQRLAEPFLPMEEAFRRYLSLHEMDLPGEQFALYMNAMYPVDAYIRDYFRKAAVDTLLKQKIPVTIMGEGWQKYHFSDETYLRREKGVTFGLSFERIAKEEILLNVSPIFNRGMHDRILAGMANETAVLTDENPYLKKHFADGEHIVFYQLDNMGSLAEKAGELLENKGLRERIVKGGYRE